jgi:polyhydroxyalkanoate synthesis regulator phasin
MEDMLKSVFLAGIGALALTYEKATQMVDNLVTKGKITVEQGKELNEELKRVVGDQKAKSDTAMDEKLKLKELLKELNLATKEDLEGLNQRISNLEKNI